MVAGWLRARGQPVSDDQPEKVVDPDFDIHDPAQAVEGRQRQWDLLVAVAAGGVLGAEARYGVGVLLPHDPGQFPWATVLINASGCLLIGMLMTILLELTEPHRLARPFLAVGVLGGYTTFSTFAMDTEQLVLAQRVVAAAAYALTTMAVCALAVWCGTVVTRLIARVATDSRRRARGGYR